MLVSTWVSCFEENIFLLFVIGVANAGTSKLNNDAKYVVLIAVITVEDIINNLWEPLLEYFTTNNIRCQSA